MVEQLAIDRAKALFGAEHANVQPHAGAQANTAVYHALLQPGRHDPRPRAPARRPPHPRHEDQRLRPALRHRAVQVVARRPPDRHGRGRRIARERQPKLILAGWSAYPRLLDFERFRAIADEVGALLMVDMAHFAGLVAAGLHPNPVPYADVVTTTIHKTLGGARGGMILCREEYAKKINSAVFPGQQGGPLEHVIAGKAVAFKIAAARASASASERTVGGRQGGGRGAARRRQGVNVLTGGTDVHLVLVDLRDSELDGQQAEDRLHEIGITVNRNAVPFDPRPPAVSSRSAHRHAGARHPRLPGRGLPRDRQDHRPRAAARVRGGARRARRTRDRDRRRVPALRTTGHADRGLMGMRRVLASAAAALLLAGCGASSTVGREEQEPPRETLTIATGGKGGVYAVYGAELAKKITKRVDGYRGRALETTGSVQNLQRLRDGKAQIGLTLADTALDAVEGREGFDSARRAARARADLPELRPARHDARRRHPHAARPRRQARQRRLAQLGHPGRRGPRARRRGRRHPGARAPRGRRIGAGARGRQDRRVLLVRRRTDRRDHEPVGSATQLALVDLGRWTTEMLARWGGVYASAPRSRPVPTASPRPSRR